MSSKSTSTYYSGPIQNVIARYEQDYSVAFKALTNLGGDRERWVLKTTKMGRQDLTQCKTEDLLNVLNSQLDLFIHCESALVAVTDLGVLIQKVISGCPVEKISEKELSNLKLSGYNEGYYVQIREKVVQLRGKLGKLDTQVSDIMKRFTDRIAAARPALAAFCYPIAYQVGKLGTIDLSHVSSNICLGRLLKERQEETKKKQDSIEQKKDGPDALTESHGAKAELNDLIELEKRLDKLTEEALFENLEGVRPASNMGAAKQADKKKEGDSKAPPPPPPAKPPALTDKEKSAAAASK